MVVFWKVLILGYFLFAGGFKAWYSPITVGVECPALHKYVVEKCSKIFSVSSPRIVLSISILILKSFSNSLCFLKIFKVCLFVFYLDNMFWKVINV